MAHLIDKDPLIAEIEKYIERAKAERVLHPKTILAAKNYLLIEDYNKLLSFVNTLEVKEIDLGETAKIFKEKEAMWMQDPITGEFIPVNYPADAPLGQDIKGNLIYPDDLKVTLKVKDVDVEKEYKDFVEDDPVYNKLVNGIVGMSIAKHFFELGLKAR